jgi:hypothetical protein
LVAAEPGFVVMESPWAVPAPLRTVSGSLSFRTDVYFITENIFLANCFRSSLS